MIHRIDLSDRPGANQVIYDVLGFQLWTLQGIHAELDLGLVGVVAHGILVELTTLQAPARTLWSIVSRSVPLAGSPGSVDFNKHYAWESNISYGEDFSYAPLPDMVYYEDLRLTVVRIGNPADPAVLVHNVQLWIDTLK